MRAARFRGQGQIEIVRVPRPRPGPGEVLIEVAANGVCGSDHKILRSGFEHTPGHEVVGVVVELGEGCSLPVGQRVAVYIPRYCGTCELCQAGRENLCLNRDGLLGWATDGGYAEYMLLPERNALPLADDVSWAEGVALLDTIGTSGHGIRLCHCERATSALVIGAGPIGIGALAGMKAFGVSQVYVSEPARYRREKAAALGGIAIDPLADDLAERIRTDFPGGVDIVVEAAGRLDTIWQALDLVKPGGCVSILGEYRGQITLEQAKGEWLINDLTIIRSFYFTLAEYAENQRMVREGDLAAEALVTHRFSLDEIDEAYDIFLSGQALKVLVMP